MLTQPILSTLEIRKVEQISKNQKSNFKVKRFDTIFDIKDSLVNVEKKLVKICKQVEQEVKNKGCKIVILSDKKTSKKNIAFPSLLALSAVHQFLIIKGF